ncbi:MAG: LysM peptidoglycan-binding domain-containing protein [Saprospiraceae bacterium]|nr:LysM peptidoglycan-binding domain-containing protein [Saprospiraceae bacterium]
MKYFITTILSIFILIPVVLTQNNINRFFSSGSEIALDVLPGNDIIFSCVFEKGQSIYNLARTFQVDPNLIYKINKINPDMPISEGRIVKVPLDKNKINIHVGQKPWNQPHLKVYYIVKKGETLFRISRVYFNQQISDVKSRNKLMSDQLTEGDMLLMGWFPLPDSPVRNDIAESIVGPKNSGSDQENMKLKNEDLEKTVNAEENQTETNEPQIVWVTDQIIALWDKSNKTTRSMYVLHNDAKIGTEMELFFPLVRTSVKAKVVGRIPEGTYTNDIALFVSPKVARHLGVLDNRFMVQVKYAKQM